METPAASELFPLFNNASQDTLEWFLEIAEEQDCLPSTTIIKEEEWGKAVFWIISGWVKVRYQSGDREVTLDIFSEGDCFGEMAILDESPRSTEIIALSDVKLLSISAQRFLQMLFKDPQLQHRLLQLTVRRLRYFYCQQQLRHQSPKMKLVKILIALADNYGKSTDKGTEIFNISPQDLSDLANISLEETQKIIDKLYSKNWLEIDSANQGLYLTNIKQLVHLVKQL